MHFAFPETWARLQAGPVLDGDGNPVIDPYSNEPKVGWDTPTESALVGCASAPVSSDEAPTVDREVLRTMRTLFCPFGTVLDPEDRVRDAAGTVWRVNGRREDWRSPFTGWEAGTAVELKLLEG